VTDRFEAPDATLGAFLTDLPLALNPITPAAFDEDLFARLLEAYAEHRAKYEPLTEFKVTKDQLDELAALAPVNNPFVSAPFPPMPLIFGIPVRLVATLEESTVYERWRDRVCKELAAKYFEPGPFLTDEWWAK
jgi:hypothetical protein